MTKIKSNQTKRISRFAYPDAHSFTQAFQRGNENNYSQFNTDSFYFRNGSHALAKEEEKIKRLVESDKVLLTTSGMSAITTALEITSLTTGDIIIHGAAEYGQTFDYISRDFAERKIISYKIDTTDIENIDKTIKKLASSNQKGKIKAIFFETVGNGIDMPVLDLKKFLSLQILRQINPLIIIDNTLSTNSIIKLANLIKKSPLKIIGLESATKFYLLNQELGGILFASNDDLFQKLLQKRKRIGATPGPSQIKKFSELIPPSQKEFDLNNQKTMQNTMTLAGICSQATLAGKKFKTWYPNLPGHPNFSYVQKKYPNGIAPVFFITSFDPKLNAEQLFYLLEKNNAFQHIIFSESFGFKTTTAICSGRDGGFIRIAAGLEDELKINQIGNQLKTALNTIL